MTALLTYAASSVGRIHQLDVQPDGDLVADGARRRFRRRREWTKRAPDQLERVRTKAIE
ncbi:hypothetical protein ACFQ1S_28030 [Kibdelosporangium lantanae]|uniref:Uncharacterized protein n=1 Tax=Kibdelosporangium lantanae TaxID=1497396 RepID=A0ABW3MEH9_9PSEU